MKQLSIHSFVPIALPDRRQRNEDNGIEKRISRMGSNWNQILKNFRLRSALRRDKERVKIKSRIQKSPTAGPRCGAAITPGGAAAPPYRLHRLSLPIGIRFQIYDL
jgi:hypothetical protein